MGEVRIGDYELVEPIGTGGLGEVFRARDTREGRTVALKLLPAEFASDAARRARFMEDAQVATALSHPAIAALYEAGESEGRLFLACEYATGSTLRAMLAQGPLHPKQAVSIALQIADALADAHAAGIVHRDLRPDNIIVTPKGAVKILEFGLASWTGAGQAREQAAALPDSAPARIVESIGYMSPEQALGQQPDAHTDIYSLGVVFYQMLTGINPFSASTPGATLIAILKNAPKKPSEINKDVPPALDPIVMKMLSRDVQARYGTAPVVASDLRDAYGERTEHVLEPDVPDAAAPPRRRWVAPLAAALVIAAVALGGYSQRREVQRLWRQWFGNPPAPNLVLIPLVEADQPQSQYADGLTDDLAMRLGQTTGIRVLGRSAMREYRGRPASQIAGETGASVILTGTIRREAGDLRIDLELLDPADGVQVWRQEFVNQPANVLAAQTVIADEVARALRVTPKPTELHERTMARTVSPAAYAMYARARERRARGDVDGAARDFESAVRADEGLVEAYAGFAEALYAQALGRHGLEDPNVDRAHDVAARAAAIEPDLAVVDVAVGLTASSYRDALRHLARAARNDPSSADAFHYLGDQLLHVDTPRAVKMYERARSLDARRFENYADLVMAKVLLGNAGEAGGEVQALLRARPGDPRAPLLKAQAAAGSDPGALVTELQKAAGRADLAMAGRVALAARLATAGREVDATTVLQGLAGGVNTPCDVPALLHGLRLAAVDAQALPPRKTTAPAKGPAASDTPDGILSTQASLRCGALEAASTRDVAATAALLQRIARDERPLRSWIQKRYDLSTEAAFDARLYPWGNVADAPEVIAARAEIRAAYGALKKIADAELKGLP